MSNSFSYSADEIRKHLAGGFVKVPRELWEFIPIGSNICFFEKGKTADCFRPGGFVKQHYIVDGIHWMTMANQLHGKPADPGYFPWKQRHDDIVELWKKYPRDSHIETHVLFEKLTALHAAHVQLTAQVAQMDGRLKQLLRNK